MYKHFYSVEPKNWKKISNTAWVTKVDGKVVGEFPLHYQAVRLMESLMRTERDELLNQNKERNIWQQAD